MGAYGWLCRLERPAHPCIRGNSVPSTSAYLPRPSHDTSMDVGTKHRSCLQNQAPAMNGRAVSQRCQPGHTCPRRRDVAISIGCSGRRCGARGSITGRCKDNHAGPGLPAGPGRPPSIAYPLHRTSQQPISRPRVLGAVQASLSLSAALCLPLGPTLGHANCLTAKKVHRRQGIQQVKG